MAKPIGNGNSKEVNGNNHSALDRSWLVTFDDDFLFVNQGYESDQEDSFKGTDSNDFIYIESSLGFNDSKVQVPVYGNFLFFEDPESKEDLTLGPEVPLSPIIDGAEGADQIIMMEDAYIFDSFFKNINNVEGLKLYDGEWGSAVLLGARAQKAGIKEVTGGSGDDSIAFSGFEVEDGLGYTEPDDYDAENNPWEVIIRGGAGADYMYGSFGDDTFLWKAGDLEDTDEYHYDKIHYFTIGDDLLDLSELGVDGWKAEKVAESTLIKVDTTFEDGENYDTNLVLLVGVDYVDFNSVNPVVM